MDAPLTRLTRAERIHPLAILTLRLVVAWGCALIWAFGELAVTDGVLAIYGWVGLLQHPSPLNWTLFQGVLAMLVALTMLGLVLWHNWRKSVVSGVIASLTSLLAPIMWWIGTASALIIASNWPELSDYDFLEKALTDWSPFLIVQGLVAALVIVILIVINVPGSRQRNRGIKIGLAVGLALAIASCLGVLVVQQMALSQWNTFLALYNTGESKARFIGSTGLVYAREALFFFLWQIPPLLWTSTIYAYEPRDQRSGMLGLLVWVLLVILIWLLPLAAWTWPSIQPIQVRPPI